jgi:hypothetical protein
MDWRRVWRWLLILATEIIGNAESWWKLSVSFHDKVTVLRHHQIQDRKYT